MTGDQQRNDHIEARADRPVICILHPQYIISHSPPQSAIDKTQRTKKRSRPHVTTLMDSSILSQVTVLSAEGRKLHYPQIE